MERVPSTDNIVDPLTKPLAQEVFERHCICMGLMYKHVIRFSRSGRLMDIMWPASQSHFDLLFLFIEMYLYSLSFLCDVCNEVHEHI